MRGFLSPGLRAVGFCANTVCGSGGVRSRWDGGLHGERTRGDGAGTFPLADGPWLRMGGRAEFSREADTKCYPPHVDQKCSVSFGWGWLQVDIEAHEIVVMRQLGREAELPRSLTFEHLHMSAEEKVETEELLAALGYREIGWHPDDAASAMASITR